MKKLINPDRLLTFDELKEVFGVPYTRQHLSRLESVERFPKRVKLSNQRVAWRSSDIQAWVLSLPH